MQPFKPQTFKQPSIPGMDVREDPMTPSTARQFARDPGPGNPSVGPQGSPEARAFKQGFDKTIRHPLGPSPAATALSSMPGSTPPAQVPAVPKSLGYRVGNAVGTATSTAKNFVTSPGFTNQPLSQVAKGAVQGTTGALGKVGRAITSPVGVGLAGGLGAMKGFETDTEQYAKRFGLEHTEPGFMRDLGVRALGVASDVGDALTLGQASRLYRDTDQAGGNVFAQSYPTVTPNPNATPLAQMDPTSPARKDPANPLKPMPLAAETLAAPSPGSTQIAPGIYRQGNSYGDSPQAAAEFASNKPVSAQNMAAADQLAARYANPLVKAAEQSQVSQNLTPADTGQGHGFGLLNSNRIAVRNAMMDAQQGDRGAGRSLAALLQQQADGANQQIDRERIRLDERQGDAERDIKRWTFAEHIRDANENRRIREQELQENSLVNLAKRRAIDAETDAANQLARIRDDYLNGKSEDDRRSAAVKLATLSGRPAGDDFITVRGGSRYDPVAMAVVNEPDILVSRTTGKPVNLDGSPNEATKLVPGKLYQRTNDAGATLTARYLGNEKWQTVDQ